ncbi:MAG: ATP-binding protein [Bacteroidales bacterium]|nr:ATP-binding protein [Bacteroidales bacterium]
MAIRRFQYNGEEALLLPAKREAFVTLKDWLNSIADELSLPDKTRKQLLISADEIFTNIASYGYPSGDGHAKVMVELDTENEEFSIVFSDKGVPYNPLETPDPDLTKPIEEREAGGLGVFVVKKMMDVVEYRREEDCNILTLKKKIVRL